jgi:hypothetical protein
MVYDGNYFNCSTLLYQDILKNSLKINIFIIATYYSYLP